MIEGLYAKFDQLPHYKQAILDSEDRVLVEASPYDTVWGVGLGADDPLILDPANWKGENRLGNVLMEVRKLINNAPHHPRLHRKSAVDPNV